MWGLYSKYGPVSEDDQRGQIIPALILHLLSFIDSNQLMGSYMCLDSHRNCHHVHVRVNELVVDNVYKAHVILAYHCVRQLHDLQIII